MLDTSFDRDSMDSLESSQETSQGSLIQRQEGNKTIILSPGLAREQEESSSQISISSSSWVHVGGEVATVRVVQEVNGNMVHQGTNVEQEQEEPVKPPRLKKLARQQSKQELLRAKGFGQVCPSLLLLSSCYPVLRASLQPSCLESRPRQSRVSACSPGKGSNK